MTQSRVGANWLRSLLVGGGGVLVVTLLATLVLGGIALVLAVLV